MKNTEIGGLLTGIFILIFACIFSTTPFIFSLDMMEWGYGIMCIGGFAFLSGLITTAMYIYRFLRLNSILNRKNILAHWTYSNEQYSLQAKNVFEKTKQANKAMLFIVWVFFIFFIVIFMIIGFVSGEEDSMGLFFIIMFSILLIISAFAFFMPHVYYRSAQKAFPEVLIAKNGIYFYGQLHTWNFPLFILKNVEIRSKRKELVFTIKYFTKLGWFKYEEYQVNVPIPEGELEKAEEVILALNKQKH